jgi:phosphatidylethanolamine/phosphatidyl-N-methylethanolamine N-methyltransferase
MKARRIRKRDESLLFLKQLVKNPKSMGALVPSSPALAEFMCRHIDLTKNPRIVEIGAGTGRLTQGLLKNGLAPENLCVIELDPAMHQFLQENFPNIMIMKGDASHLPSLLPAEWVGQVDVIVSGIPMVNLSFKDQFQIIQACFKSLSPNGTLLQFTYGPISPLPSRKLGLRQKRLGHVFLNFPPATIWQYSLSSAQELSRKRSPMDRIKRQSLHQLKRLKKQSLKVLSSHEKN